MKGLTMQEAIMQAKGFQELSEDWDSYGAGPIDATCITKAIDIIKSFSEGTPTPWVVPCSDGGIQLEWHEQGMDLELSIKPDGCSELYFKDEDGNFIELELKPGDEMADFDHYLKRFERGKQI